MRLIRVVQPALAGMVVLASSSPGLRAQGWNPFPDREPSDWSRPREPARPGVSEPQRGWRPSPREAARDAVPAAPPADSNTAQSEPDPSPGRGRPPGVLGELRGGVAAPPADLPPPGHSGSIIPDRQRPSLHDGPVPRRQAVPRDNGPGGYRPYDRASPDRITSDPAPRERFEPHNSEPGRTEQQRTPPSGGFPSARPATSVGESFGEKGRAVDSQDLAPMLTADGSRLPAELWRGTSVPEVEQLMSSLSIPPRSAALHDLWRRLLTAKAAEPAGGKTPSHFLALRLAALYKSGLLKDLESATAPGVADQDTLAARGDLVLAVQRAKAQLGLGQRQQACDSIRSAKLVGEVPRPVALDALLLNAYCAAADGNAPAASMTVDMAREQGLEAPLAFAIADHLAGGSAQTSPNLTIPKDVSLIDYRFMQLAKVRGAVLDRAEPALVTVLARESTDEARAQIEAAEDAARLHALDAEALAKVYREVTIPGGGGDPHSPKLEPPLKRAALAQAIAAERTPARKARLIRALLQEARSHTLYMPVARALVADVKALPQAPDLAFFAETAVEVALAGSDYATAVSWAVFGSAPDRGHDRHGRGDGLMHWTTLIDIVGAREFVPRGSGLRLAEELALKAKLPPEVLHRLVTVLDALEYNVPIPLWEAASRTPQPTRGHLPDTGVLGQLNAAAADQKFALTVLLAMRALGPDGPEGAHMLALGDTIRALKRAGLEEDARRVGFEALFAAWPRGLGG